MLVVDDNETAREVLTSYLEDFSFYITAVSTGELALRELTREKAVTGREYDLVLMDYQMPGLNGIETSRKIRRELENIETPKIIMVTAFGREEIMQQADEVGLQGFLIKPVNPSMLFDTIMEAYDKEVKSTRKERGSGDEKPEGFDRVRGARILLVEDNEINQQVAVEILEHEGFRIDVAVNGKEAVSKLSEIYDLILMDLQMPVMDGYKATEEIRKNKQYDDLPIIAMTADAMSGVREKVIDIGMNDYVTKPIVPKDLWMALVKWIKPGERELPEGFTVIDPKILKKLFEELKPVLESRKPKPAKKIIEKINSYTLPDDLSLKFEKLSKFVGKYKFKDAIEVLKILQGNT